MIATKVSHLVPRVFPHNCPLPPQLPPALFATCPKTRKWGRGERSLYLSGKVAAPCHPLRHLHGFPSPHSIPLLSKPILNHLSKKEFLQRMFQMTSKIGRTVTEGFKTNRQTVPYPSDLGGKFTPGSRRTCSFILGAGLGKQDVPVRCQRI